MAGPMMIDLGKRAGKRALHAVESALSWQGWNSANPLHPKGPDGRWVKGHPFTRIIGDAPDHIHHLSDEDLASVDQSAESLLRAITAEKGRRGIGRIAQERGAADIPASRTYGTRPKEDFSVAGGSEEALATAYSQARPVTGHWVGKDPNDPWQHAPLIQSLESAGWERVRTHLRPGGAGARGQEYRGPHGETLHVLHDRELFGDLKEEDELTQEGVFSVLRESAARASRTYGTRPKEDFSVAGGSEEALATAYSRTRGLRERLANARTREEGHALLSDLEKKDLLQVAREMNIPGASALSKDNLRREMVEGSVGRRLDMIATRGFEGPLPGMGVPNPAKPLRAARKPKTDIESVRANWEAAVNGPMPSDRERFRAELSGLTLKQLEELNGEKLPAGAKAQKINHMIEHRLGFRLNSETIGSTPLSRAETPEQVRIRQEMHAADLAGDRETYRRLHLERLNHRLSKMEQKRDEGLSRRFQLETRRDELQASLREQYGTNANGWPYDSRREELDRIWDELEAIQGGKRAQAPAFDITDAGHRQARINELTAKINAEPDAGKRATLRKERAELATWKEPGSKRRPREPFRYEGESVEATKERHAAVQAAAGPAFERDQKRAKETADQVRALLKQARGSTGLKDEQVLEIVQGAKLNPRQMRLLADEFAVDFSPHNAFESSIRTKAGRETYFASSVAGAHRRNPLGRTSVR